MAEPATRVALLARPGAACDNLQAALRQVGADVVAVQDPGDGDPAAIAAARPAAVLVALEPAVEDALARYDAVLSEPGRLVIYDEVSVAARREGWDAARWARHLAAKLGGHADVLPPGAGNDDDAGIATPVPPRMPAPAPARAPAPAGPPAPAEVSADMPAGVPAHVPADVPAEVSADAPEDMPAPRIEQPGSISFDAFDADAVHLGAEPAQEEALANAGAGIDFGGFTPEIMAAMGMEPMDVAVPEAADAAVPEAADAVVPEAAEAAEPAHETAASGLELAPDPPPAAAAAQSAPPARFSADEMSLVDMEPVVERKGPRSVADGDARGGVVVFAGIGGPDAVRQFLGSLPGGFSRPIIVRQRLDGGRHDRLVRQMQRATALPVELAEAGRRLVDGHVYILPDGLTTEPGDGATAFVPTSDQAPLLAGLPAADSAVLMLSGSDPAIVPEAMQAASEGALVVGQLPEESFDGAAAAALVAAGGESRTASELAQRLGTRWLSLKD